MSKSWKHLFFSLEEGKKHPMNHTAQHGSPAKSDRDHSKLPFSGPLTTVVFIASFPLSPPSLFPTLHLQTSVLYTPSFYLLYISFPILSTFLPPKPNFLPHDSSHQKSPLLSTRFFSTYFSQYLPFIYFIFTPPYLIIFFCFHFYPPSF